MKIAYTGWTWLLDEFNGFKPVSPYPRRDFEQSLKDLAECGYDTFENFQDIVPAFEEYPEQFTEIVAKYGLDFGCVYHYLTEDFDFDMAYAERIVKFLVRHGGKYLNLEPPERKRDENGKPDPDEIITEEKLAQVAERCNIMGKLCADNGIVLSLHPHYGTAVETEAQIDYIVAHTDPKLVNLCLDTAHTYVCGMDPATAFEKYLAQGRVTYVHFKDVDPAYNEYPSAIRAFLALGQGVLDFRGILKVLRKYNYDDIICVELDHNRVNNFESAMYSRQYLKKVLGL